MIPNSFSQTETASRNDRGVALRATEWLALGAAPTFAFMAAVTGILGAGGHGLCSAASHPSVLGGMIPMYVLMSAFHVAPWLKLISRWRGSVCRTRPRHQPAMERRFARQTA